MFDSGTGDASRRMNTVVLGFISVLTRKIHADAVLNVVIVEQTPTIDAFAIGGVTHKQAPLHSAIDAGSVRIKLLTDRARFGRGEGWWTGGTGGTRRRGWLGSGRERGAARGLNLF